MFVMGYTFSKNTRIHMMNVRLQTDVYMHVCVLLISELFTWVHIMKLSYNSGLHVPRG